MYISMNRDRFAHNKVLCHRALSRVTGNEKWHRQAWGPRSVGGSPFSLPGILYSGSDSLGKLPLPLRSEKSSASLRLLF